MVILTKETVNREYNSLRKRLHLTVRDITGLEQGCFDNIANSILHLMLDNNRLTELDVSGLVNLQELSCSNNQLTILNVSGLVNLQELSCSDNQLTTLNVSGLVNLKSLYCGNNQLTTLNVSGFVNLTELNCGNNQLTTLYVSGLVNLMNFICTHNKLTTLDVSGLVNLQHFSCIQNKLTTLDVSGLVNLQELYCTYNQLTTLYVSGLVNLTELNFSSNELTDLNVSGNFEEFNISDNLFLRLEIPQIFEPEKENTFLPGKNYDIYMMHIIKGLSTTFKNIHSIKKEVAGNTDSDYYMGMTKNIPIVDHITDILINYVQLVGILDNFKNNKLINSIRERIYLENNKSFLEIIKTKIFGKSEIPSTSIIIDNYSFFTHFNSIVDCPEIVKKMALKMNLLMLLVKSDNTTKEITRLFSFSINQLKRKHWQEMEINIALKKMPDDISRNILGFGGSNNNYKNKYLKYKQKYLSLKNKI